MLAKPKGFQLYFWMRELVRDVADAKLRSIRFFENHVYAADGYIMAKIPTALFDVGDYLDAHFNQYNLDISTLTELHTQAENTGWLPCGDETTYDFKHGEIRLEPKSITSQDYGALVWTYTPLALWDEIAKARQKHFAKEQVGFASMKIGAYRVNSDYIQWMLQLPALICCHKIVVTSVVNRTGSDVMPLKFSFEGTGIEIYLMSTYS